MRGGSQVLEHRILVADPVAGEVKGGGQGGLLVLEHQGADILRVQLDDDGERGGVVFGRDGKGVDDEEVGWQVGVLVAVSRFLGGIKGGHQDLPVENINDVSLGGLGDDWQSQDAQRGGAGGLVYAVELVGEGLDLGIFGSEVCSQGGILLNQSLYCCINLVDLADGANEEV